MSVLVIGKFQGDTGQFEQFQQFFSNPELQAFIGSVGAAPAPPEVTITEAITSADQF
jgi:hypothetical protein